MLIRLSGRILVQAGCEYPPLQRLEPLLATGDTDLSASPGSARDTLISHSCGRLWR